LIAVLDACALIAFLRGEAGAAVVSDLLTDQGTLCLAHSVNLCEVYYDALRASDETIASSMIDDLRTVGVVESGLIDRPFWSLVGQLKVQLRVSLADSFALALTVRTRGTLFTSDHHEFDPVSKLGICRIQFIR
jgi:PIN domain nuclease of toxin-antitoxin system